MKRSYYSDSIANFCKSAPDEIMGKLAINNEFSLEQSQRQNFLFKPWKTLKSIKNSRNTCLCIRFKPQRANSVKAQLYQKKGG